MLCKNEGKREYSYSFEAINKTDILKKSQPIGGDFVYRANSILNGIIGMYHLIKPIFPMY